MPKLYFRYGAMGSSKTANALMVRYNYAEKGRKTILVKPGLEDRDGKAVIRSRIGLEAECVLAEELIGRLQEVIEGKGENFLEDISAIIVDEAQFLTKEQVDLLSDVVDRYETPVICYGLRTDFLGRLFEGAKRLMELADVIEEIPTICWCGKRAHFNARIRDGRVLREGAQIELGGNESYISLCRKHYKEGKIAEEGICGPGLK